MDLDQTGESFKGLGVTSVFQRDFCSNHFVQNLWIYCLSIHGTALSFRPKEGANSRRIGGCFIAADWLFRRLARIFGIRSPLD